MSRFATLVAVLVGSQLFSGAAVAQTSIQCPLTLDATYGRVGAFEPDTPRIPLSGFVTYAAPDTRVRLIGANIVVGTFAEGNSSTIPDNMEAPANVPQRFTLWDGRGSPPAEVASVACIYDGGLTLLQALPRTTRSCTLTTTSVRPAANAVSRREALTRAAFACR